MYIHREREGWLYKCMCMYVCEIESEGSVLESAEHGMVRYICVTGQVCLTVCANVLQSNFVRDSGYLWFDMNWMVYIAEVVLMHVVYIPSCSKLYCLP